MTQHHAQTVQLVNLPLRHDVASEDIEMARKNKAAHAALVAELQRLADS
jgi:hypothetical protein